MICRLRSLVLGQGSLRARFDFGSPLSIRLLQAVLLFLGHLKLLLGSLLDHYGSFWGLFVDRVAVLVSGRHQLSPYFLLAHMSCCNVSRVRPRLSLSRHVNWLDHNRLLLRDLNPRRRQGRLLVLSGLFIYLGQPSRGFLFHELLEICVEFSALLHQFPHGITQQLVKLHFP